MDFYVLTLFPDMITQGLNTSITGKAIEKGLLSLHAVNIRDYTKDKHKKVDDYPYGGGAGMLMQAQPVSDAWHAIADGMERHPRTIYVTPQGRPFTQKMAKEFAKSEELVFLCGHYEGIDERVLEEVVTDYVSIGDYVLTGGELASMVMIDAVSRLVPGVLNNEESAQTESFHNDLLEHPQYSRPVEWKGKRVPEVLLSGNQKKIASWRLEESVKRTKERRPDLYQKYEKLQQCKQILQKEKLLHRDMIELIERGQAEWIYQQNDCICLKDQKSGAFFFSARQEETAIPALEQIIKEHKMPETLVLHQEGIAQYAKKELGYQGMLTCTQYVYTRKEKLPITGLYRLDGTQTEDMVTIERLNETFLEEVLKHYHTLVSEDYVLSRLKDGAMYGAFLTGKLAGFIGVHEEGSMGMLEVFPEYRGRKLGKALETYLINLQIEQGMTPYGQVVDGNEISTQLQKSLGLCPAKTPVYWMESIE